MTIDEEESHDQEACYKDNLHFITELPNSPSYYSYVDQVTSEPMPQKRPKENFLNVKDNKRNNRGKIERCKTVESSEDESEDTDDSVEQTKGSVNLKPLLVISLLVHFIFTIFYQNRNDLIIYLISEKVDKKIDSLGVNSIHLNANELESVPSDQKNTICSDQILTNLSYTKNIAHSNGQDTNISLDSSNYIEHL